MNSSAFRQTLLVFGREFRALRETPLYYVLTGIFFLLTSMLYVLMLVQFARGAEDLSVNVTDSVVRPTFHMVHFFLLVQVPLLTMRIFAEDRSNGMLDLLQTTPLQDWPLLGGKFAATTAGLGLYVLLTMLFPLVTGIVSTVEWPVVAGSLMALLLSAAAYTAVGTFFSTTTESQVVAAVLSYVTLFLLVFANGLTELIGLPALADFTQHFSVTEHIEGLLSGNVAPMNVAYFVCVAVAFLFLSARVLEARRWGS